MNLPDIQEVLVPAVPPHPEVTAEGPFSIAGRHTEANPEIGAAEHLFFLAGAWGPALTRGPLLHP